MYQLPVTRNLFFARRIPNTLMSIGRKLLVGLFFILILAIAGNQAHVVLAGSSPSQWVVVVNGKSPRSRTIANYYTYWRNIPSVNVIVLDESPSGNTITLADFRDKMLVPILDEVAKRGLGNHVQGIAYSSDLPLAVDLGMEPDEEGPYGPYMTKVGSINGLTYLHRFVREIGHFINVDNNWYAGRDTKLLFGSPTGDNGGEIESKKRTLLKEKKFSTLGYLLDEELKKYPDQFPLAYQSAQAWAEAGQPSRSLQQLQRAIESGWTYSKYLQNDERLKSLMEFNLFQTLVKGCETDEFDWTPAAGFDSRLFYAPNGVSTPRKYVNSGINYLLSMSLAVCGTSGNTEQEAIRQLKISIDADFTRPEGSFYFTETEDPRSKCRQSGFKIGIDKLKKLGFEAEIIREAFPMGKKCLGATLGISDVSWPSTKSTIMPGAIVENLTSLGGAMEVPAQTKLTEFLRYGAAASSGTVTEPFTISQKFPHATIHAYYAAGLTAAEAYYSSVSGPYQLLIAGDPLCAPFAKPPRYTLGGVTEGMQLGETLNIEIVPEASPNSSPIKYLAIHVDGEFKGAQPVPSGPGAKPKIRIPSSQFKDGAHEIRLIAFEGSRLGMRYERSVWVLAGPEYNQIKMTGPKKWKASDNKPLSVEVVGSSSDAVIEIFHGKEYLATVEDGKNSCEIPTEKLGRGPVRLQAIGTIGASRVASLPLTIVIE
jgi:hypothetical protein